MSIALDAIVDTASSTLLDGVIFSGVIIQIVEAFGLARLSSLEFSYLGSCVPYFNRRGGRVTYV